MEKVMATEEARLLLSTLKESYGRIILVHSEGCCDGTFPLCVEEDAFYIGSQYEKIGVINEVPYYMHTTNQSYWKHLQIVIEVTEGIGNSFSLESAKNKSFLLKAAPLSH